MGVWRGPPHAMSLPGFTVYSLVFSHTVVRNYNEKLQPTEHAVAQKLDLLQTSKGYRNRL